MPEPLALALGLVGLVTKTYKLSRDIYELANGISSAPPHIVSITSDIKAFHLILGTLESLLQSDQVRCHRLMQDMSGTLQTVLTNCIRDFRSIGVVIHECVGPATVEKHMQIGVWRSTKWAFKEKEIQTLRCQLESHKNTCTLAVNTANLCAFALHSSNT